MKASDRIARHPAARVVVPISELVRATTTHMTDAIDRPGAPWIAGPSLLRATIDGLANVCPELAFGRPIHEMEPFATSLGMEAT